MSYLKSFYETLIAAGTYAAGVIGAVNILGQAKDHAVYIEWGSATTAGGEVVVEQAAHKDYAGDWSNLSTFAWTAAGKVDVWRGQGAIGAIRTRVNVAIAGGQGSPLGGVKTYYVGN